MKDHVISIAALNQAPQSDFMAILGDVVEHSPWVTQRAFSKRPFESVADLHAKMTACIRESSNDEKIALFNLHPELAGKEAVAGAMTENSTSEQGRLGLAQLSPSQFDRLSRLNREYRDKFGFPFIIALRLHRDLTSVLSEFESRLRNELETEMEKTLEQISDIVYGRLCRIFAVQSTI